MFIRCYQEINVVNLPFECYFHSEALLGLDCVLCVAGLISLIGRPVVCDSGPICWPCSDDSRSLRAPIPRSCDQSDWKDSILGMCRYLPQPPSGCLGLLFVAFCQLLLSPISGRGVTQGHPVSPRMVFVPRGTPNGPLKPPMHSSLMRTANQPPN